MRQTIQLTLALIQLGSSSQENESSREHGVDLFPSKSLDGNVDCCQQGNALIDSLTLNFTDGHETRLSLVGPR